MKRLCFSIDVAYTPACLCLSVCLSVSLSVCLCLSVCLSVSHSVSVSVSLSRCGTKTFIINIDFRIGSLRVSLDASRSQTPESQTFKIIIKNKCVSVKETYS